MNEDTPSPTKEQLGFNPERYSLEEMLKPKRCALIIIDMQKDFMDPEGFFAKKDRDVSQMQSIVPNIQKLIDSARLANIPIIFTQGSEDVKFRKGKADKRRAVKWKETDTNPENMNSLRGTSGWEFYGVHPQEGDIVIEKHKWSAFDGKDKDGNNLRKILKIHDTSTLIITGVVAETCVETTIRDAYSKKHPSYNIIIPENSVGSDHPERLKMLMDYWAVGHIGDVVNESAIQERWAA
ncbi:MAG: hypothetical protein COU26_04555 [Candidatus Levybacteria bacterium CG10_big_fil_rev_8_21_14_0_10_36_30]|nr:MAG: hypothetical protein COU26_04555 [Candidatus Levybacteria bacterium CG10_big_fil_rev_8_21_14_0_10_36_30]